MLFTVVFLKIKNVKLVVTLQTQTADWQQKSNLQVIAWKELDPNFKLLSHMGSADVVMYYCPDGSGSESRSCVYEKLFYGLE